MNTIQIQNWIAQNPLMAALGIILASLALFLFTRNIVARGLIGLAARTQTKVDDILVKHLRPFRIAWLAPLTAIYAFAYLLPVPPRAIEVGALFLIMWVSVLTINSLLDALNEIYESSPNFKGVSIQGYFDLTKLLIILVAVILSVSLFTGESPLVLLTGLGALTAVLLLIFRDTLLSLVASIQIGAQDLIKEGDWIEVPSYGADGDVVNISLHAIQVRNFDNTFTVIPTYKMVEVAYKNWRGMQESGGRRIQRSLLVDMTSIKFCDEAMLRELRKIDLIQEYLDAKVQALKSHEHANPEQFDSPLDGPQITNTEVFRAYIVAYLKNRPDIHKEGMPFLVRTLAPNPTGLPIEVYVFTTTTSWTDYEQIQAEIFDHLLAAAGHFHLRVFQEPTGLDFAALATRRAVA